MSEPTAKAYYEKPGHYWSRREKTYPDGAHHVEGNELHFRCAACDEPQIVENVFSNLAIPDNSLDQFQLVADCKACGKPTLIIVEGDYAVRQIRTYTEEPEKKPA